MQGTAICSAVILRFDNGPLLVRESPCTENWPDQQSPALARMLSLRDYMSPVTRDVIRMPNPLNASVVI